MAKATTPVSVLPGISSLISATNELLRAAAQNESPVFLTGEVGTEKAFAAKLIHQMSRRAHRPLTKINVSWKLPPNLAQYFQQCSGGSLIIHLQKEFPIDMQYTLVEMASHGSFADPMSGDLVEADVRVLLMTSLDMAELNHRSPLLPELKEILSAQHIEIPPLRSRPEDIPALVRYAITRARETGKTPARGADPQVLALFRQWTWPGNAEDLLLVTAQAAIGCRGELVTLADLPEAFLAQIPADTLEAARQVAPAAPPSAEPIPRPAPATVKSSPPAALHETPRDDEEDELPDEEEEHNAEATRINRQALEAPTPLQTIGVTYADRNREEPRDTPAEEMPRSLRVLQLARRLNAQSQVLSRQMTGPIAGQNTAETTQAAIDRLMSEVSDEQALESLEKELGRGLDLVLAMRRQLAVLNVRQAQTQETIRDLVQRLAASEGQTPADQTELAREASELSDTLRQIDQIIHRISNDLPRAGEYLESTMQGQLPESIPSTSGIFRRPSGGDLRPPTNG